MTVRTLFIGMDGATFTVLNDLTARTGEGPVMPSWRRSSRRVLAPSCARRRTR